MHRTLRMWRQPLVRAASIVAILILLLGTGATVVVIGVTASASAVGCQLNSADGLTQHVIYIQFDNVHFTRDNPNVPSDLEQMPHLLSFIENNGVMLTNNHTPLISHTADDILTSLTGMYPDRNGQPVANSYGFYGQPAGVSSSTSSFKYWTDPVDGSKDSLPNMITTGQKNTPAPWVPFTRAGCDVGGVGTANIELENTSTASNGDITKVFGNPSTQATEAMTNPHLAQTDFVGIAIHCAQTSSSKCAGNTSARADSLPDEPGGYTGFQALYGAKYVDPSIASGNGCVNDTAGAAITDPLGNCGFPGFDGMLAKNTLGYIETMQESGVPITYGYISDAHDVHTPNTTSDSYGSTANGPGEAGHEAQLAAYDAAFQAFFQNLAAHGINQHNTLFVFTADEGDHFAGGAGTPAGCDGVTTLCVNTHTECDTLSSCPANQIGEVDAQMDALLAPDYSTANPMPGFNIHFDDAPTFYVNGQPGRTDPTVRTLERNVGALTSLDPYVRSASGTVQTVNMTAALADTVEEQNLHMINADPARTPTFTMFGNPDFFFTTGFSFCSSGQTECANPTFAWNHGDIQPEIVTTWLGMVGPGVPNLGVDSTTWSDHTDIRPTIMALVGLHDDYVPDGRVLVEDIASGALPASLRQSNDTLVALGEVYKQLDASVGQFGMDTLRISTAALESGNVQHDSTYTRLENQLISFGQLRDTLAGKINTMLIDAEFNGQPINEGQALGLIAQATALLSQVHALAQTVS
jgi:hypothetical protein